MNLTLPGLSFHIVRGTSLLKLKTYRRWNVKMERKNRSQRMNSRLYKLSFVFFSIFAFCFSVPGNASCQNKRTITIPARSFPAQTIPGTKIPACRIPAKTIPAQYIPGLNGIDGFWIPEQYIPEVYLPAMTIPPLEVPAIYIPARVFEVYDFSESPHGNIILPQAFHNQPLINDYSSSIGLRQTSQFRRQRFIERYGYNDPSILSIFNAADEDRDGKLSFFELEDFQKIVFATLKYRQNDIALRPDKFLSLGGGDCDDWALFSAAFCDYWGWEAYIAVLSDGSPQGPAHAVCFARPPFDIPSSYTKWRLSNSSTADGFNMTTGTYVSIDYDCVGTFSSAVKRGWKIRYFLSPSATYGLKI